MSWKNLIHIGTSGWNYEHWKGPFYEENCPEDKFLEYYIQTFQTVEINNTFYGLPEEKTLESWKKTVPDDFIFSVKANRYITHMKKLKDPRDPVANFMSRIKILADNLGPILFQLPPNWNFNGQRLQNFLRVLPDGFDYTFELRNPSWLNEDTLGLLKDFKSAFCIYEFEDRVTDLHQTTDFVYIRLHGPDGAYQGKYDYETVHWWAEQIIGWAKAGTEVYCYFDNDQHGFAPQNAVELLEVVGEMN